MAEQTIRRGQNAMVQSSRPTANLSTLGYPSVASLARYVFLSMPVTGIAGQTVVSAILSPRFRGAIASQQLAVQPVAASWAVDKITWANQPGVRASSATKTTGVVADGARTDIDITALVQQIANGDPHYGWRIATTGTAFFYGFATIDSWVLTVETSDAPQTPVSLEPEGVVSLQKFVIRTDFTDYGGSTTQSAIQVQVDPDATAPYAFDSGEVATTAPELDLATTAYAGLSGGATTQWRVRVKDTDGYWSGWSDWATVTRVTKPTLILDAPTGGVLYDPTPTIQAHLSAGNLAGWSVMITDGADRTVIRYSSGQQPAPSPASGALALTIPERNADRVVVFPRAGNYQIRLRAWDRTDRVQGGPTDPPYIELWTTVGFSADGAVTAPTSLTATSPAASPRVLLTWTRGGTADGWVIERDSNVIARLQPDDVTVNAGTYTWTDGDASPNETHTWSVRAVTGGHQGSARTVTDLVPVNGVWLLSVHGDVVLDGTGVDNIRRADRRATYKLPGRPDDVDIIGALEGLSGAYQGSIQRTPDRATEAALDADRLILRKIRRDPTTPVRLAYGTSSVPVLLRNLSVTTSPDYQENNRQHLVSFECFQCGDFED